MPQLTLVLEFLKQIQPFSSLPEDICREIADAASIKKLKAKEHIFLEGEEGQYGYVVHRGRVAMVKSSPNGREMIVELLPMGEPFGVIVFIDDRPYPLTARAQSDAEVIAIPRSVIVQIAKKNPAIFQEMLKIVSGRLQSSHNVSRAMAHDRVEVRIAATLCALISRMESEDTSIEIGRQELADLVGTTIETASRVCKQFEKDGILELKTVGIVGVIDRAALFSIANDTF